MEVREATADDQAAIREIAKRSLEASYSLSPQAIESGIRQWFGPDEFAEKIEDDEILIFVVERNGEPVAFSENALLGEGEADLLWLHVHPDYRGEGIGSELFETTRNRLEDYGVTHLRGRVLSINQAGNTFYKNVGFEKVGEGEVRIDDSPYTEALYLEAEPEGLQALTADGETVYVDHDDVERGSLAPFHVVYADQDREEKYGYHCSKCDSLANAMDSMGRIECGQCGNSRKPTRWDASYM
ncbi:GNAT family N-acetyltransferase [Halorientalis salina]|uniref:GNAT family N-acetyltransferase n=1 Tax=Halorientalis salina TaxID=2932266 RepID=UPI0010ABE6F8|nr:GNAT family N-acetyltransferase [Halorientalis salina]